MDGYTIDLSGDYLYAGIEMADTVKRETFGSASGFFRVRDASGFFRWYDSLLFRGLSGKLVAVAYVSCVCGKTGLRNQ